MSPASILINNLMLIESLPKSTDSSITTSAHNTIPSTVTAEQQNKKTEKKKKKKKNNNNNNKQKNKHDPIVQCAHTTAEECASDEEARDRLNNIIASSPTPLLYRTVNRSWKMYDFVVRRRNNSPSAQYLLREYPRDPFEKLCPCGLYPPYKARRADSTSNHDLMLCDSPEQLCLCCLRTEGRWTAHAQKEYVTYYAPLYTLGEKEEIFRLWKIEAAFINEPWCDNWFKNSVQVWMTESLRARNSLSEQQSKNLRKREQRKEKQLQLQLMERDQAVAALKKKL